MAHDDKDDELLPRMARHLDYFHTLTEMAKTLTSSLDVDQVSERLMRSVSQLLSPGNWSLLLVDKEKQELYFKFVVGEASDAIKNLRLPMGEGIAGWVASSREPTVVAKVADDPRFSNKMDDVSDFQTSSILCVPLVVRDEVLGVIELVKSATEEEPFSHVELEVLVPLAEFVAIAIDNAQNYARLQEITILDEWTGLYNARFLQNYLPDEVARAKRYKHEFSLIFFDLDNFKDINDTHGHSTGSSVLREVGTFLKGLTREPDRAIRYGGDEFVMALPHTGKEGAAGLAQRLCEALPKYTFESLADKNMTVTASFGVATFPENADDHKTLLEAADQAMYMAKARRKNNVVDASKIG
jgi:diguanylate cyclase (GGDEF)-like protein